MALDFGLVFTGLIPETSRKPVHTCVTEKKEKLSCYPETWNPLPANRMPNTLLMQIPAECRKQNARPMDFCAIINVGHPGTARGATEALISLHTY
jgi:hypothetical protein